MVKSIQTRVVLSCHDAKVTVPLTVKEFYDGDNTEGKSPSDITAELPYDGVTYIGRGKDFLYTDALADLQRHLPEGTVVCCCMTCRFGNMCPFGNAPGVLFCSKGRTIRDKNDVISLWEEDSLPQVSSFGYCDAFAVQDGEHYTYNDYDYQVKNPKGRAL